jgi:hypothetical protein
MRLKTQRKVIYATMGLTVLALIGGFGLANLQLGSTNTVQQGSIVTTVGDVTGVSWTSMTLFPLTADDVNRSCSAVSPCSVTSSSAFDCAGGIAGFAGCQFNNLVERIVLTTVPGSPFAGTLVLTPYVTVNGTTYTGLTFYYTDGSGNSQQNIVLDFGVGNLTVGPGLVTGVTLLASA